MKFDQRVTLRNGKEAWLRNGDASDGHVAYEVFHAAHAETDYLLSYPDEGGFDPEQEGQYLKEKAESFSDAVVRYSPNALIVVNDTLEVQQLNDAAIQLLHIRFASDVLGDQVVRILDPRVFMDVKRTGRGVYNKRVYLAEYQRYVEQTVVPAEDGRMILCIMRDVTVEEEQRQRKEEISHETVEVADKVVEKQMRIVQEIASLLGETAAETKIAMAKLKESISDE